MAGVCIIRFPVFCDAQIYSHEVSGNEMRNTFQYRDFMECSLGVDFLTALEFHIQWFRSLPFQQLSAINVVDIVLTADFPFTLFALAAASGILQSRKFERPVRRLCL